MITDFEYRPQRWGIGWVVGLSWKHDGKPVRAILLGKNGARYMPPKPPDDPLVDYLMTSFGMKVSAARLLARKVPKKDTLEERILAVHRLYEKEGR